MQKKFTINLDIEQITTNALFYLATTDLNSPFLTINILESAVAKNLTGITSAYIDIMKPDGSTVSVLCTISNAIGGVLTVTLPAAAIPLSGQYKALVKITDSDGSIANTNSFIFDVQAGW